MRTCILIHAYTQHNTYLHTFIHTNKHMQAQPGKPRKPRCSWTSASTCNSNGGTGEWCGQLVRKWASWHNRCLQAFVLRQALSSRQKLGHQAQQLRLYTSKSDSSSSSSSTTTTTTTTSSSRGKSTDHEQSCIRQNRRSRSCGSRVCDIGMLALLFRQGCIRKNRRSRSRSSRVCNIGMLALLFRASVLAARSTGVGFQWLQTLTRLGLTMSVRRSRSRSKR